MGTSDHAVFQEDGRAAIVLGESGLLGFTNTRQDKDLDLLDFPELNRLADAVADFIETSNGKIY